MIKFLAIVFIISLTHISVGITAEVTDSKPINEVVSEQAATSITTAEQQNMAAEEQSGFSRGSVSRSIFTTEIADREPVDDVKKISNYENKIYYFTELRDMSGQTAIHRWEFNGSVMAETKFNVRGPRWRVWSSKYFVSGWTGEWKVSVLNSAGETISEDILNYTDGSRSEQDSASAINEPTTTETKVSNP